MGNWGPFSVAGQNVIVTGGAAGIGAGIAARFVEGGANVLIVDLDEKAIRLTAERLSAGPGKVAGMVADIADEKAPAEIVARCLQAFGGIDTLVNNAGIFPQVPVLKMAPEQFDRVLRINLRGLVFLSKAVGQELAARAMGGAIINIGSVDSVHPSMVGLAAYDASKGGVLMFTRNFALEMAPHKVRVNAILPGGVATEGTRRPLEGSGMTEAQQRELTQRFIQTKVPMGRMGVPDDIAKVAVFLASSAAGYMTGSATVVDGGMLLA